MVAIHKYGANSDVVHYLKHYMNWSFRMATTIASKMLANWHEERCNMAYI
jgi:hypothetical protein